MDTRFTSLRATLAYEGLTEAEINHGTDLLDEAAADRCDAYDNLLRGALADRGHLLPGQAKMAQNRGLVAGAKLATQLLTNHQRLDAAEVNRGLAAITRPGLTCDELLALYLKTRRVLAKRAVQAFHAHNERARALSDAEAAAA